MIKEIDVLGVYVPPLLLYALIAALAWRPLRFALERLGLYRYVWHPALFDASAYVVILAVVVAALM